MTWLSENWLFVLLLAGALVLLMRRAGMGCAFGGHGGHRGGAGHGTASSVDPVSHELVAKDSTIAAVYGDQTYRFASKENRDRFEADPQRFAKARDEARDHHRGGHGCC